MPRRRRASGTTGYSTRVSSMRIGSAVCVNKFTTGAQFNRKVCAETPISRIWWRSDRSNGEIKKMISADPAESRRGQLLQFA